MSVSYLAVLLTSFLSGFLKLNFQILPLFAMVVDIETYWLGIGEYRLGEQALGGKFVGENNENLESLFFFE